MHLLRALRALSVLYYRLLFLRVLLEEGLSLFSFSIIPTPVSSICLFKIISSSVGGGVMICRSLGARPNTPPVDAISEVISNNDAVMM